MWLGWPGQSAALLGTAAAMSSTALVSRQLADQASSPPATAAVPSPCWSFRDLASVPLLALLAIWARGESPKIEHVLLEVFGVLLLFAAAAPPRAVCCMACWLGGAAGPRGIVRARLLVRGGGCRRRCARGRRIRRPGAFLAGMVRARATSGTTWKATPGFLRCVVGACSS